MSDLDAILACREERVRRRSELQQEHGLPAVVFTLNIPGTDKASPLYEKAHRAGEREFRQRCSGAGIEIVQQSIWSGACGREALFLPDDQHWGPCQSAGELVKRICVSIESQHPLGRIFDFDVYSADGTAVDRQMLELPQRRCFLCAAPARECARLQRHPTKTLRAFIDATIKRYFSGG